jgi:hypothetical protein
LAADERSGCAAQMSADLYFVLLEDRGIGEAPRSSNSPLSKISERSSAFISG